MFRDTDVRVALWTSSRKDISGEPVARTALAKQVAQGNVTIVVGTHALLQPDVHFHRLGLAVVDEQHRFGVVQRQQMRQQASLTSNALPHFLSLSATPIPRSLALTLYGDLDVITCVNCRLVEPIVTKVVANHNGTPWKRFCIARLAQDTVFVICPLITESDQLGCRQLRKQLRDLLMALLETRALAYSTGNCPPKPRRKHSKILPTEKLMCWLPHP